MAVLLSYALTTVADVKESLGIPSSDTTKDNLIIRKINQATLAIENYCGRHFALTEYTDETYNATNTNQIVLRQRPVVSVTSLGTRDTSLNEDDFDDVEAELYFSDLEAGLLNLNFTASGPWSRYRVSYSAGYSVIPADLAEACASLAAYYVTNAPGMAVGVSSMSEGQRSVSYGNSGQLTFDKILQQLGIDQIINSYANYPVMTDR